MFICAQIDANNVCFAVARLREPVQGNHIIPLEEWRDDILGWTYNRDDGQFYPPAVEDTGEQEALGYTGRLSY